MKSPSILEKFNVKFRKNAKSECYCVYNQRELKYGYLQVQFSLAGSA